MDHKISLVYLTATSYSGSTLLSILMNAHPQVTSVGELDNSIGDLFNSGRIDQYSCSCGLEIKECQFWDSVKSYCSESGIDLDLHNFKTRLDVGYGRHVNKLLFGTTKRYSLVESVRDNILWKVPGFRRSIKSAIHRNRTLTQAILRTSGKKIFFDASKDPKRGFYLAKDNNTDFKLVHLVRDITGFINSCRKRQGDGYFDKATNVWIREHRAALRMKAVLPRNSYLQVKYERLCEHTMDTIQEICQFIGVDTVDLVTAAQKQPHHIIGNSMRRRPLDAISADEAWKKNLSAQQIVECLKRTNSLRRELGYE